MGYKLHFQHSFSSITEKEVLWPIPYSSREVFVSSEGSWPRIFKDNCLSFTTAERVKLFKVITLTNSNWTKFETIMMQLVVSPSLTQRALVIQRCSASRSRHVCRLLQAAGVELSFSGRPACKRQTDLRFPPPRCKDKNHREQRNQPSLAQSRTGATAVSLHCLQYNKSTTERVSFYFSN